MPRSFGSVVFAVAALLAACGSGTSSRGPVLSLRIPLTGDPCGVTRADATVSAPGMPTIGPVPLTVSSAAITGQISDVPAGTGRLLDVAARNADGLVVYEGSTSVDVIAGQSVAAQITLVRNTANCAGTGTITVSGTIADVAPTPDGGDVIGGAALAFTADDAALTGDGVLAFFDAAANRIHRLDLASRQRLPDLAGTADAVSFAVAPDGTAAYLGYVGGRMDVFDLDAGTGRFFAAAPGTVSSMLVTGSYLFTVDGSGAWNTHSLFQRSTGARVDAQDWRDSIRSMAYAPSLGRVFYLDADVSPTDVHRENVDAGHLSADTDSPYHGDYALRNPLRLLPDQTGLVVGSGLVFNTADLTYRTSIGLSFTDIAFLGDRLYLVDQVGANAQLRVLDSGFNILEARYFPGTPRWLFAWSGKLVLVLQVGTGLQVWFVTV